MAAGGGSRLVFRNGLFAVGPESVGAHPGPVCYKKGGHLAITDANLQLGRILPKFFPKVGLALDEYHVTWVTSGETWKIQCISAARDYIRVRRALHFGEPDAVRASSKSKKSKVTGVGFWCSGVLRG